jgi:hypothetical protein
MSYIRKTVIAVMKDIPFFFNFSYDLQGFDALNYEEHLDYELVQSTNPEFNKARHPFSLFSYFFR